MHSLLQVTALHTAHYPSVIILTVILCAVNENSEQHAALGISNEVRSMCECDGNVCHSTV